MQEKKFEQHSDYKLFLPGKSWIFVNPSHGCPLNCSYCIEQKDNWFQNEITEIYSPTETIESLFNSPIILQDKTPLTFYNFSDPFLPKNRENLYHILKELDSNGWKNKIGLITKINPGENYLKNLSKFNSLKLAVFVSYANLNPGLESVSYETRINLMKSLKGKGIKTINYVRPLVKEWTNKRRIYRLGEQIKGNVDAIVLSGLRLTPEIMSSLNIRGLPIPPVNNYTNKERNDDLFNEATDILKNITNTPVFWHTSCAMSYVFSEPDYNGHDIREKLINKFCPFPCIDSQRKICDSRKDLTEDSYLEKILERTGKNIQFEREGNVITLSGPTLNREDISFVRHIIPEFVRKK